MAVVGLLAGEMVFQTDPCGIEANKYRTYS